jgi:cytochrome P450
LSYVNVKGVRGTLNNGMPKGPCKQLLDFPVRLLTLPIVYHRPGNVVPMLGSRDASTHTRLRKPWNRAFTTASLKDYEHIVVRRARELIENLDKRHSQQLDISEWMEFFS